MNDDDAFREIESLRTLVSQLRACFPKASPFQRDKIGEYLLRALWLGAKKPDSVVFGDLNVSEKPDLVIRDLTASENPALRIVDIEPKP